MRNSSLLDEFIYLHLLNIGQCDMERSIEVYIFRHVQNAPTSLVRDNNNVWFVLYAA
jgi:hypothetical protein